MGLEYRGPASTNRGALMTRADLDDLLCVVRYNGSAYPARPAVPAGCVRYVGPTQPADWLQNDEWVRTDGV